MIINHPLLGPRDAAEFTVLGDANLLNRPNWQADDADDAFYKYLYLRDNPAGLHRELWFHEHGDRSWLVVTRDTETHAILEVALARDLVLSSKASKASRTSKAAKTSTSAKGPKASRAACSARTDRKAGTKKPAEHITNRGQPR